jgi:hypothetical protein
MMSLLCEKIIVAKSKEVKLDQIWQNLLMKAVAKNVQLCQ